MYEFLHLLFYRDFYILSTHFSTATVTTVGYAKYCLIFGKLAMLSAILYYSLSITSGMEMCMEKMQQKWLPVSWSCWLVCPTFYNLCYFLQFEELSGILKNYCLFLLISFPGAILMNGYFTSQITNFQLELDSARYDLFFRLEGILRYMVKIIIIWLTCA